jgi:hypothetical protein
MDDSGLRGAFDWEDAEDITTLSEEDLKDRLRVLSEEERAISYRQQILQGRIDLIRAELVERGVFALSPEGLARILLGEERR